MTRGEYRSAIVCPVRVRRIHRYLSPVSLCRDLYCTIRTRPSIVPIVFNRLDLRQPLPRDNRLDTRFVPREWVDNNRERVRDRSIFFSNDWLLPLPTLPSVGGARSNEMTIAGAKCKVSTGGEKVKEEGCTVIAIDCARSNGRHGECTWIPFHPRISDIRR